MLVIDFQLRIKRFLWDIDKENHNANLLVCNMPDFVLILWWYVAFFNDITYQRISQNIEKYTNSDTKNIFTRKYTNRSK